MAVSAAFIADNVCVEAGHHFIALDLNPIVDPVGKTLTPQTTGPFCQRCGYDRETLLKRRIRAQRPGTSIPDTNTEGEEAKIAS